MRRVESAAAPPELVLGQRLNTRVPAADQRRQRTEVDEVLRRLERQPGVIVADEVGMGKTFVALAIAYSVAVRSPQGPVVVMVPSNLVAKWEQDLKTFCELYLVQRRPAKRGEAEKRDFLAPDAVRYGVAIHSIDLMRLLDDPARERCKIVFVAQGAMARQQSDSWIRLALIAETLRRHGRGKARRLIQVKKQIHRYLGELLWSLGLQRRHALGEELWLKLFKEDTSRWKAVYNAGAREQERLDDDPVPKAVTRAIGKADLRPLAEALEQMPVRARGGTERTSQRVKEARRVLSQVENDLWKELLAKARWRSPLLVMDEAHHLKNPATSLSRQFQAADLDSDLRTGDGAMADAFDCMVFLTATPFQLGHHELIKVLERFGDVRWDATALGPKDDFTQRLEDLEKALTESQRSAVALQRRWSRLRPDDCPADEDVEGWWSRIKEASAEALTSHQRAVVDAFGKARACRDAANTALAPWVIRHNKGAVWEGTSVRRRRRMSGAAIDGGDGDTGIDVPPKQLLPFFLAARSAARPGQDLLGEALSSSYEAFRRTREDRRIVKDDQDDTVKIVDVSLSSWYLGEFDRALTRCGGEQHPKISATVRRVVDLWEAGEKVLVFAFYRHTCRALRVHISEEIQRRLETTARARLGTTDSGAGANALPELIERIQKRFFDDERSPGRRALDRALTLILEARGESLRQAGMGAAVRSDLVDIMRRFLRVQTTLVRCFPLADFDTKRPEAAVEQMLAHEDSSLVSWRNKFDAFVRFVAEDCSTAERESYMAAAIRTETGRIQVEVEDDDAVAESEERRRTASTFANVQVATGVTKRASRARLMLAFNTPFFPDILVCSEVMSEGVDLQRFCREVIHHDLAWNPSTIEQRTGRIDRLGCKAEGRNPIDVYLPYLAGTSDERQFKVMTDRERWFQVVMGQDEVAKLIRPESSNAAPLPEALAGGLAFKLGLGGDR